MIPSNTTYLAFAKLQKTSPVLTNSKTQLQPDNYNYIHFSLQLQLHVIYGFTNQLQLHDHTVTTYNSITIAIDPDLNLL